MGGAELYNFVCLLPLMSHGRMRLSIVGAIGIEVVAGTVVVDEFAAAKLRGWLPVPVAEFAAAEFDAGAALAEAEEFEFGEGGVAE